MSAPSGDGESTPTFKVTIDGDGVKVARDVDAATATEILGLVMGGGSSPQRPASSGRAGRSRSRRTKPVASGQTAKTKRRSSSPNVVRDLSLRPKGKTAFVDFADEKKPATHQQKQVVIVHWLRHEAGMSEGITTDHVNTCYLEANWPRPSDLSNALAVTSKRKGWLDTSDLSNIRVTTRGEDEVNHNLPPKPKKKA